jgi:hypothetical protein
VRGGLLLLLGLGTGLGAGWALFATGPVTGRASRASAADERPDGSRTGAPGAAAPGDAPSPGVAATGPRVDAPRQPGVSEEEIIRQLVKEAYAEQVRGEKSPDHELFEAAVRQVMRETARNRHSWARNQGQTLVYREQVRGKVGDIAGSPLLLQMRVAQGASLQLTQQGNSGPLTISGPPPGDAKETHVTAGMVPPGSTFLVERVAIHAWIGPRGRLQLDLPESESLEWEAAAREIDLELKGLVRLRHGDENRVRIVGSDVAVSVEIHGRLVPEAQGESGVPWPLVMGDGLTGGPVLMQVLADHGGGNPRTVHLDGKMQRIGSLERESIWTEPARLKELKASSAHYRGCGRVPPGMAFRITRVTYRAQLDPEGSPTSSMVVRIGGKDEIKANASKGPTAAGSWSGDILVLPGDEREVSLTVAYFVLAEVVLYGELVDDPRGPK